MSVFPEFPSSSQKQPNFSGDRFIPRRSNSIEKSAKLLGVLPSQNNWDMEDDQDFSSSRIFTKEVISKRLKESELCHAIFGKSFREISEERILETSSRQSSKPQVESEMRLQKKITSPLEFHRFGILDVPGINDDLSSSIFSAFNIDSETQIIAVALGSSLYLKEKSSGAISNVNLRLDPGDVIRGVHWHPTRPFAIVTTCKPKIHIVKLDLDSSRNPIVEEDGFCQTSVIESPIVDFKEESGFAFIGSGNHFVIGQKESKYIYTGQVLRDGKCSIIKRRVPLISSSNYVKSIIPSPLDNKKSLICTHRNEVFHATFECDMSCSLQKIGVPGIPFSSAAAWHPQKSAIIAVGGGATGSEIILWNILSNRPVNGRIEDSSVNTESKVYKIVWARPSMLVSSHLERTQEHSSKNPRTEYNVCLWSINNKQNTSLGRLPVFLFDRTVFADASDSVLYLHDTKDGCVIIKTDAESMHSYKYANIEAKKPAPRLSPLLDLGVIR